MLLWALQYAQFVRVTKPQELVDKIKAALKSAAERYER
jgi:predicted DNA-binding transcriptional regulator YafY